MEDRTRYEIEEFLEDIIGQLKIYLEETNDPTTALEYIVDAIETLKDYTNEDELYDTLDYFHQKIHNDEKANKADYDIKAMKEGYYE